MAEIISKVRVHGKAQGRTCLGIVHAYMVMYPQTTAEELRKAFPGELTPKYAKFNAQSDNAFRREGIFHEIVTKADGTRYYAQDSEQKPITDDAFQFEQADEVIHTADGKELSMESAWTEDAFKDMVNWAKQYGIEVASFEKTVGRAKGGFTLEYLNGYVPPVQEKKSSKLPLIIGIIAAVLAAIVAFLLAKSCGQEPQVIEREVVVHDTVVVEVIKEIKNIEKNFNAAKFVQGKADLTEETKFVLHDLENLLKNNPKLRLKLVGHTSSEGAADFNQKLSEARAKAAVDFLISRGVPANQLEFEGKGSAEPISDNAEENRRTEFIVLE